MDLVLHLILTPTPFTPISPTLETITTNPTSPSGTSTSLEYTFTFDEAVTNFDISDIKLSVNGATAVLIDSSSLLIDTDGGTTYTLDLIGADLTTLTNLASGDYLIIDVDMTGVSNTASEIYGTGTVSGTWIYDLSITSIESFTGTGTIIISTDDGILFNNGAEGISIDDPSLSEATGKPSSVSFPHGLLSWKVTGLSTAESDGETITVTLTSPSAIPAGSQFWKIIDDRWVDATSILGSNDGDNILTLTIKDGGNFDADKLYDGTITDPSGSGFVNDVADDTSNGGCDNCEAPTLGIDSKANRIVANGFTYNGESTDVERFYTPYPLITVNIGEQNTAIFKIYEDTGTQNIKHFSFAFGLGTGQIIGNSKAMIELDIDHEGTETVTVTDPGNALENINVSTDVGSCNGESADSDSGSTCLIVTIDHTFRAPLDFNIVATDVWDMKRNAWQNYYNHGIEIMGESLNPPNQYTGINAGHIYHLTETSKTTAVDEFDNAWSFQYGTWMKDYIKNERLQDDSWSAMTRMHSDFAEYKELQAQIAQEQLLELCDTCLDSSFTDFANSWAYEFPEEEMTAEKRIKMISHLIEIEKNKAQQILDDTVESTKYH